MKENKFMNKEKKILNKAKDITAISRRTKNY